MSKPKCHLNHLFRKRSSPQDKEIKGKKEKIMVNVIVSHNQLPS